MKVAQEKGSLVTNLSSESKSTLEQNAEQLWDTLKFCKMEDTLYEWLIQDCIAHLRRPLSPQRRQCVPSSESARAFDS
jgi:hypothetical protein